MNLPERIHTIDELEELLSRPSPGLVESFRTLEGDIMFLGAGGKMGPSLAEMAVRASREAGVERKVYAVSRFSSPEAEAKLQSRGIRTIRGDLLDREFLAGLPETPNVVFMVGRKFGTSEDRALTWVLNAFLPGLIAERFRESRILCFSTGNVYPLVPLTSGGATEQTPPQPVGEYAQSALARERIFEYFSEKNGTRVVIIRLNYAVELRYGVVLDIARRIWQREPIPLSMPAVNVIWQGDANDYVLRALGLCSTPPTVLNVTGPEIISVRWLAERLCGLIHGEGKPEFDGTEPDSALLSNASLCFRFFGYPRVPLARIVEWTAEWLKAGLPVYDKPTHFETRDGAF
jgi:nucleoside-diphosphate-sugar epimerase